MVSFFRKLFRPSNTRPAIRTTENPLAFYLNGEGRLQAVKQDGLLRGNYYSRVGLGYLLQNQEQYARAAIASVWAANCINLRADTLARLDWHVRDKKSKRIIDEHPFTIALENSQQNVIRLFEKRLLTYGEVFIKPLHNDYGQPSGFMVLNNLDVDIDTSPGYVAGFQYNPQGRGRTWHFKPEQLIYVHTDNDFDDLRGLSKFEHVLLEIHIDRDISRTTAAFYRNDARPGLLLIPETDLTEERAGEFIEYWNARFKGPDNTARPAILPSVIKEVREFQRAPALDDVELRESTRRETCAAFKTPLSMAGAWDDATYQSLPEQRKAFYEETVIPEAESVALDLTKAALPYFDDSRQNEVYFDAEKIMSLVEDVASRVDVATRKLNSGAYTINEVRKELDDEPILGGDIHIMQSGWIPVHSNDLATFEAPNTQQLPDNTMPDNAPPQLPAGNPPEMITAPDNNPPDTTQAINSEATRHEHQHEEEPVDAEYEVVKTIHAEALQELGKWQKFLANGNASKREFRTYMIRDEIALSVKQAIETGDSEIIKAAFEQAQIECAIKAVNRVRSNFETEIKSLIDGARRGNIARRAFTPRLKQLISRYTADAYRAGLSDGGVIIESGHPLNTEDAAIYQSMLQKQLRFAVQLADQIYKGNISDAQARLKPRQWWAKSGQPFYDAGLLSANRNSMIEIIGPIDDNSCETCKALVGQRHRRKTLHSAGLIPPWGSAIICSDGGLCKHRAIHVTGRSRGNLSRVPTR